MALCCETGTIETMTPAPPSIVHSEGAPCLHQQQVLSGGRNCTNGHNAVTCNGSQTPFLTPDLSQPLCALQNTNFLNGSNQERLETELENPGRGLPSGFYGRKSDQEWHRIESTFQPPAVKGKETGSRYRDPLDGAGQLSFWTNKRPSARNGWPPGTARDQRGALGQRSKITVPWISCGSLFRPLQACVTTSISLTTKVPYEC